jgi:hypothetical protein
MAGGQHKLSRRALLGALCASPLVRRSGLDPESTCSSPGPEGRRWIPDQVRDDEEGAAALWDRALVRLQAAQAVLNGAKSEPDQDVYDRLLDAQSEALRDLLALPAPDLPALAAKLDVIVPEQAWELSGCEDCLDILREDARRLDASGG